VTLLSVEPVPYKCNESCRRKIPKARYPVTNCPDYDLAPDGAGDVTELPNRLDQIDAGVASITAGDAFDGETVYVAVAERHPDAAVIVPPWATEVSNQTATTQHDRHIETSVQHVRMDWHDRSVYHRRSPVETSIYRNESIVGRQFHTRPLPDQRPEAKVGSNMLNRMMRFGMAVSTRVYYCAKRGAKTAPRRVHAPKEPSIPPTSSTSWCSGGCATVSACATCRRCC
jgi:hypothetical protein